MNVWKRNLKGTTVEERIQQNNRFFIISFYSVPISLRVGSNFPRNFIVTALAETNLIFALFTADRFFGKEGGIVSSMTTALRSSIRSLNHEMLLENGIFL